MTEFTKQEDSRRIFINTLEELHGPKNILVTCDVGMNYVNTTKLKVFNFGVTEPSSTLISAALGLSGYTVWLYSMINFVTFRVHEQVRNGIVMHKANVKIIGVKGSEAYKFLGFSHNLLYPEEDIDFCKNIKLRYYTPQLSEVREIVLRENKDDSACYIRL